MQVIKNNNNKNNNNNSDSNSNDTDACIYMVCAIESSMQEHVAYALEEMARMEIAELNRKCQFFPSYISMQLHFYVLF